MTREEVVRGLERFIDDYKRYINHADFQRLYNALALLKERGPKVKPQFDDDALDRNTYIKVGDLIDCMTELSMPEDAAFHLAGAIEWACGKRAVALPKEQEPRVIELSEISPNIYVWLEDRDDGTVFPLKGGVIDPDGDDYFRFDADFGEDFVYYPTGHFEKLWRVWDKCPTEEQMRETPWEEVHRET